MENHARLDCALDQNLMQPDTPQCESGRVRKLCARGRSSSGKPDSRERNGVIGIQMDSERAQRRDPLRQQTLSARFVNRRSAGVQDNRSKSLLIRCDRSRDPRGSRPNYDDVAMWVHWNVAVMTIRCPPTRRSCICRPQNKIGWTPRAEAVKITSRASKGRELFSNLCVSPHLLGEKRDPIVRALAQALPPRRRA